MKVLITGSSGFIGSALKTTLIKNGDQVIEYDTRNKKEQDVRSFHELSANLKGVDGVVHLAAVSRVKWGFENPRKCVDVNVRGVENVLESARQSTANCDNNPWVIFGSSREVFGEVESLPVTELTPRSPLNVYGITKLTGEELCKTYSDNYSLKTRVLRFSNVYSSPHDHMDRVVPKFVIAASKNEPITIHGSGEEFFDFTHIEDTVSGIVKCIKEISRASSPLFDNFILSAGRPVTFNELASIITWKAKSKSEVTFSEARSYDVTKFYANPVKAKERLGFSAKIDIKQGIAKVLRDFKRSNIL